MLSSRRVATVVLSTVATVSLVACDADQVGSAAVVGGERITVSDLQDEVRAVSELAGTEPTGDQGDIQKTILQSKIQHQVLLVVADEAGVSVSDAEVDEIIAEQYRAEAPDGDLTELLVQNSLTEDSFRQAIHDQLLYGEVVDEVGDETAVGEMLAGAVEDLGIDVNPRYGEWEGLSLNVESTGSISVPAAGPEPLDIE